MTVVVVNPADIREDADDALLGLERKRGEAFQAMVDEVFASDDNLTFGWFGLRTPRVIYTRRDVAVTLDAHLHPDKWLASVKNKGILDLWVTSGALLGYHGYMHHCDEPVRELIASAQSLNATELQVDARTLMMFEDAYATAQNPYATAE